MKRISYISLVVVLLSICGCESAESEVVLPQSGTTTITVGIKQTKTSLGASENGVRKILWSSGDRIVANGEVSDEAVLAPENSGVATFNFGSELPYPLNILYPASFYKDATTVTLPAIQEAGEASFATNTLPMATSVTAKGDIVKLSHLAGVIHLRLKAEKGAKPTRNNEVRKIEFWGNDKEQVSGDFTIDYNSVTLTPTSQKQSDEEVAVRVTGTLTLEEYSDIFIVVPAQEYKSGFTVRVINSAGHYMDKKKSSGVTIANGDILKMPEMEYIPTGTLINAEL
ncbi:MAG: hypothetical protein J6J57_02300 [Alistipes sp.]|nr:hypothetical protein [Alistipes sp.]